MGYYNRTGDYDVTQLEDEWMVLNTDNFTITTMNEVGSFCWSLLENEQCLDNMVGKVKAHFGFDVADELIKKDIESFLTELSDCGLVEYVEE